MTNTYQSRGASPAGRRPGGPSKGRGKGGKGKGRGARTVALRRTAPVVREPVTLPSVMTVADLADQLQTTGIEIIKELMKLGMMANLNQQIDYETAHTVATALGWETHEEVPEVVQQAVADFESRRI